VRLFEICSRVALFQICPYWDCSLFPLPPVAANNASTQLSMADWKQITARIRRAKGSKDPVGQLCNLFQKTRDAMVAFELARHLETVKSAG